MLSLYELKNKSNLRWYHKTPYWAKNMVMMVCLAIILTIIEIIDFEKDSISYLSLTHAFRGVRVKTFVKLQDKLGPKIKRGMHLQALKPKPVKMTSQKFFD